MWLPPVEEYSSPDTQKPGFAICTYEIWDEQGRKGEKIKAFTSVQVIIFPCRFDSRVLCESMVQMIRSIPWLPACSERRIRDDIRLLSWSAFDTASEPPG